MEWNILLTSDWHKIPFKEDKFKTQKPNLIEKIIIWLTGSKDKLSQVFERIAEVIHEKDIDLVINDGDMMENPQNERGLAMREGINAAKDIKRTFCGKTHVHMKINAGNHELGYRLPLSTDPEGGMSIASIAGFQELAGIGDDSTICQSFTYGGCKFILFPFGLMQESAKDFDIEEFKANILRDLTENFMGLNDHKPILLFLHDPEALVNEELYQLIKRYQTRIARIFCGHWHATWAYWPNWLLINIFSHWWLYPVDLIVRCLIAMLTKSFRIPREIKRDFRRFKNVPARMRELEIAIIPAPLGMLGFGGGFLTLNLETMEVTRY